MHSPWFKEVFTEEDMAEMDECVRQILLTLLRARLVCAYIPELIDERMGDA